MSVPRKRRISVPQAAVAGLLMLVLFTLLAHRFTSRSAADKERARARITLQTIYQFQQAYFAEYGTYLPINREKNSEILKLNDMPGQFRYQVVVADSAFVAVARADLDGDGEVEVWQIDQRRLEPFLTTQD